ncbi:MAG: lipase family protein [Bradyrhizobium sp.]|nr:lipase family protein [Bradyrhizobium sp.]
MSVSHYELVRLAWAAYAGPWTEVVAADVRYSLIARLGETVVALPGTHPSDPSDWLRDLSVWPARLRGLGLVHAGFGLGARAAWVRMAPALPADRLVTFTGHSLGGALAACLGAIHAYERPGVPFRVVTFGQPRVALLNPCFGRLLGKGVERALYARRGDIVPDVPPRPYLHGGRLTLIGTAVDDAPIGSHSIGRYADDVKALSPAF